MYARNTRFVPCSIRKRDVPIDTFPHTLAFTAFPSCFYFVYIYFFKRRIYRFSAVFGIKASRIWVEIGGCPWKWLITNANDYSCMTVAGYYRSEAKRLGAAKGHDFGYPPRTYEHGEHSVRRGDWTFSAPQLYYHLQHELSTFSSTSVSRERRASMCS